MNTNENENKTENETKKTVVYLHGYGSNGQSSTVRQMRRMMPEFNLLAPDIPENPAEALPFLKDFCKANDAKLIIGTDMGAMYAMQMFDYYRICVNPALHMSKLTDMLKVGTFNYFQPTADGRTQFTITDDTIRQFREMEAHMFDGLTDESRRKCWGFFGDKDEIINCKMEFARQFFPNIYMFSGCHRMNFVVLREVILPFIRVILGEEYTDEWGVTYSSYGRILKSIDYDKFTCEEYTVPEGVEIIEDSFDGICPETPSKLKKIHLPSTLRKMEVNTFLHCPIEEIELPKGVEEVPGSMCECCRELKRVKLPSTIKSIEMGAFNVCPKLEAITMPDGIEYIEENAFANCTSLRHIHLPLSLETVSRECFHSSGLESIEIHENIDSIEDNAFWWCNSLKSLTIPETVKMIGSGIVTAHEGFEGIVCHAEGYHVENDALISDKDGELLCCWTTQKDYVVPSCVKKISDISGNDYIETITVNQNVEICGLEAFASDRNLRKVIFKGNVIGIGMMTFYNCPKLEEVPHDKW